jgi:hypothetical protein
MRHETLIKEDARRRGAPYAPWEREGRCVFIDQLPEMPTDRLKILADDLRISISLINGLINTENTLISQCQSSQPMAVREIKKRISRLLAKKSQVKLIMLEAGRLIKDRNREANKPKVKREPICMNQADHNELSGVSRKLQSLKMQALFPVLREAIGVERLGRIEAEATAAAIPRFKEWANAQGIRSDWVEHLTDSEERAMQRLLSSLTSPTP